MRYTRKVKHLKSKPKPKAKSHRRQKGGSFLVTYNSIPVKGQELSKEQTQKEPIVNIPKGFTLLMYDPDAIQPSYIHWLKSSTNEYIPYQGPSPPTGTGTHRYRFVLFRGEPLQIPSVRSPIQPSSIFSSNDQIAYAQFMVKS